MYEGELGEPDRHSRFPFRELLYDICIAVQAFGRDCAFRIRPGGAAAVNNLPILPTLPIVDSHLDLAENVTLFGRDLTLSAAVIRKLEERTSTQAAVSLPAP